MFLIYFFISIIFCSICYLNLDPIKSSFFLIFSLLRIIPLISYNIHIWYSYFICLLFLRGIFVILVYFSSLSKINFVNRKGVFLSLFITLFFVLPRSIFLNSNLNLTNFYYNLYWFQLIFIIIILLIFINFSSYFLNFSGALRKI